MNEPFLLAAAGPKREADERYLPRYDAMQGEVPSDTWFLAVTCLR